MNTATVIYLTVIYGMTTGTWLLTLEGPKVATGMAEPDALDTCISFFAFTLSSRVILLVVVELVSFDKF